MGISERRKYQATARRIYSRPLVLNVLRVLWIVVVVWGELGTYYWSLASCRWPDKNLSTQDAPPTHVLLVSDPQVRPPRDFWEDNSWLASARELFFELNLKRNWHVTRRMKPQAIFFLGDMLASGKYVHSEPEFEQYWQKFLDTCKVENGTEVHYLPGNNDFGMGASLSLATNVRAFYKKYVGPLNQAILIRGHNFVALDAPGLVDEDYRRSASGLSYEHWSPTLNGSVDFVRELDTEKYPVVLLSHIPLFRPDTATCGHLREKGTIRRGVGHGYQNTLGKQTSYFLLDTLHPVAVFSGDNRDFCEYNHTSRRVDPETNAMILEKSVREVTIKSFSMARSIHYPGFHLLSLADPSSDGPSLSDTACFLPDQSSILSHFYWPFVVVTSLLLLLLNLRNGPGHLPGLVSRLTPASPYRGRHPTVWTPFTAAPDSPTSSLPMVRTPTSSAGPQMRASSRPASPSFLHPSAAAAGDAEEDEDETFPAQYATRRAAFEHDDAWTPRHNKGARSVDQEAADSYFLQQAPALRQPGKRPWSWTWTFVFARRRRRITLRLPSLTMRGARDAVGVLGCGADSFDVGLLGSTALDALSVLWVAVVTWTFLAWKSY
ncbi:hypothetical protein BD626DRAFT_476090 [Schizophyllum amplum]|uniref:Calcineurin-like phosphoesterase domain-containing protein n=1 Tax=Schizophyllum amplum TaxID=97359 RepID=A0A550CZ23_9AGAR|nr:hypothetical protein BD626DRAFT_476090 [Auriculariopsis ampla]